MESLLDPALRRRLERVAESRSEEYRAAEPFAHIVIDGFLPPAVLGEALREFPSARQLPWIDYDAAYEKKLAFPSAEDLPRSIRDVLYFLNSAILLRFLENLTGISGLIPDPYFTGGGLHQIEPGGFLGVHADFNKYEKLGLDRRINLLLYMNRDWKEEYGGHLELWDRTVTSCIKRVLPVFNRCVIFNTTDYAYHGHPEPLRCPDGWTRKSIAIYYYTNGRPEEELAETHSTLFQRRPGEPLRLADRRWRATKRVVRELLPPILTDLYYRLVVHHRRK